MTNKNLAKFEKFSRDQRMDLARIMANVIINELANSAFSNVLQVLDIVEPDSFDYYEGEDANLFEQVRTCASHYYFYRLSFKAIYDPKKLFAYVKEAGAPLTDLFNLFDDLEDNPTSKQIGVWLDKVSDEFQ